MHDYLPFEGKWLRIMVRWEARLDTKHARTCTTPRTWQHSSGYTRHRNIALNFPISIFAIESSVSDFFRFDCDFQLRPSYCWGFISTAAVLAVTSCITTVWTTVRFVYDVHCCLCCLTPGNDNAPSLTCRARCRKLNWPPLGTCQRHLLTDLHVPNCNKRGYACWSKNYSVTAVLNDTHYFDYCLAHPHSLAFSQRHAL